MQPLILLNLLCVLQNRNCRKEILILFVIPPWFQACIYWKKSYIWRYDFQTSIFSIIVSLFDGSLWSNPHVKETVLFQNTCSKQAVCSWFEKNWRLRLLEENQSSPALLKIPIYSPELVATFFVWKELCWTHKNTYRDPTLSWGTSIAKLPAYFQKF